jgi:serine/threonine-protein kinase TTK/MPS1
MIGKGGSSRVFRVLNHANELFAIKRVSLDKTDAETMSGYMNEIALLKRLEGNSRIIRLIDSEVKAGPGGSKGHLLLVMECGEVDLSRLIQERAGEKLNMVWVAYYWQQVGWIHFYSFFFWLVAPASGRGGLIIDFALLPSWAM